jgi:spectinomycin phosphotransferase
VDRDVSRDRRFDPLSGAPGHLAISEDVILERLRERFGLDAIAIEFLALASDADVRGYRVAAADGDRFLKIRRGPVSEAGLIVPQILASHGIRHLIAPIPTVAGRPCDGDDIAFILFPLVEGVSGGRDGLSPAQWKELGATVRAIHDHRPDHELTSILRTEDFVPATVGLLRDVEQRLDATDADPAGRELASLWRPRREQIDRLAAHTELLARRARDRAGPAVVCHADIHAWNVLITPDGDIVIVDWDEALLAPRERDLMFVDGVAGGHAADPPAFFQGYGDVAIDAVVLTYYRAEWTIQDLALYAAAFLAPDAGDEARAESLEIIAGILAPGSEIDIVTRAVDALGIDLT